MPISLGLVVVGPPPANNAEAAIVTLMSNLLTQIDRNIESLTNLFRPLFINIIDLMEGYRGTSLRVFETNPILLDHAEATRWAVAYLSYVQMVELLSLIRGLYGRVGHIRVGFEMLHRDLVGIAFDLSAFGNFACALLQGILDELRKGISVTGSFMLGVNFDPFKFLDAMTGARFLKLLGLLAMLIVLLAALVGFVAGLGLALQLFTLTAIGALLAIAKFVGAMIPLVDLLGKMKWTDIVWMTVGLAALAGFVYLLSLGLSKLSVAVLNALPKLSDFIDKLKGLAESLKTFSWKDVVGMTFGLAALAGFVYVLGLALNQFNVKVMELLPKLGEFIDKLKGLAESLKTFTWKDIVGLAFGLGALAGFVYVLGLALNQFNTDVLKLLPGLSAFIDKLTGLAVALKAFTWKDIVGLAFGLAGLAGFVYLLGLGLNRFNVKVMELLPKLGDFIDKLGNLAETLASLGGWDIVGMIFSLAALAGFVYVLGMAMAQFTTEALAALPRLGEFIEKLGNLGLALAQLAGWDIAGMAVGLAALAGFVYLLALALNQLGANALATLPGMNQLIVTLNTLAVSLAGFTWEKLGIMALGLAAVAVFVWALAAAAKFAGPELLALAGVLTAVERLMNSVAAAAGKLIDAVRGLGGGLLNRLTPGGFSMSLPGGATTPGPFGAAPTPSLSLPSTPSALATSLSTSPQGALPTGGGGLPGPPALANLTGGSAGAPRQVDQSMKVEGGIHVDIKADRLEANAAHILSDEIVRALQSRLNALRAEQEFRTGVRAPA